MVLLVLLVLLLLCFSIEELYDAHPRLLVHGQSVLFVFVGGVLAVVPLGLGNHDIAELLTSCFTCGSQDV